MKKIVVFTDVHGNFEALKKLTETEDFKSADQRICLGDIVGLGPFQKECMDLIVKTDTILINGNHEARITGQINDLYFKDRRLYYQFKSFRKELKDYLPLFNSMPLDLTVTTQTKKLYFTHFKWENGEMAPRPQMNNANGFSELFDYAKSDFVFFGHIHTPMDLTLGDKTYVCVGALGCKHLGNYVVIYIDDNGNVSYQRKYIDYDLEKFLNDAKEKHYPRWDCLQGMSFSNIDERRDPRFK